MEAPLDAILEKIGKMRYCTVTLQGDVIENNDHTSAGSSTHDQYINPDEQFHQLSKKFKKNKIRRKILGIGPGNHDDRPKKKGSIDVSSRLAETLDVPLLESVSLHNFHINDESEHVLCISHGATGATTLGGKINAIEKQAGIYEADAYVMGHVHHLMAWPAPIYNIKGSYDRWFGINGSFMDYLHSYAQKKGYRPGVPGYISSMIGYDGIELVMHRINGESWFQKFLKEYGEEHPDHVGMDKALAF